MHTALTYHPQEPAAERTSSQSKGERTALLTVLAYEGLGALLGGALLVAAPDGRLMDMPVAMMRGVFPDFRVPGLILFALGLLSTAAFGAVWRRGRADWLLSALALGGLLVWFWVEIAILQQLHWLHAMWGLPVLLGVETALPLLPNRAARLRQAALWSGILASLLYVAINVIVPPHWPGYNSAAQTVSELSAIGAPTRVLWNVLATPYTLLMLAFGWVVWASAGYNRRLRSTGILLLAYAALGICWPFAPMHLREALAAGGGGITDTLHITLGVVTQALFFCALGFAAGALGRGFLYYSLFSFLLLLVFGTLTFLDAPALARNLPTPLIGVWERINIGVFLLWVVVLALQLLRTGRSPALHAVRGAGSDPDAERRHDSDLLID
ncbi:DUF998 domain-containing protein [Flaviaesturariibacter aridisoli]|uniref:DUF998 domain-containing protein n=1 Tax=Flaviaesturariibacter aridisoli TaxID=2545761 RepID=A0A4R4DV60_9BACT|nr:DUF998 domain-containing protein [Flaviaesturariibacter aridisoli]TCZ66934.1 DUF998 domain-containing protein [Flaviaesturariibacter aridisoli]